MKHDPFYSQIINKLNQPLDFNLFELLAVELARSDGFAAVPITGGNDAGMDGAIADGLGPAFPVITTTHKDVIGNVTRNIKQYSSTGGTRGKFILVTSQALTPQRRRNIEKRAVELSFILLQIYEQAAVASFLYRHPNWCRELLHLSGTPSALSIIPLSSRVLLDHEIIGRDEDINWIIQSHTDGVLVGEPGSGKTSLLYRIALTEDQKALFVISRDTTEIANAIRAHEPSILFVDDAHIDPDFLVLLRHLRSDINADFRIIATCWNGDRIAVADRLNVVDSNVRILKRLTRDEIVNVIHLGGIQGPNRLVREIVDQSEGLPGLAVTLTHTIVSGGIQHFNSGEALLTTMLGDNFRASDDDSSVMLAGFAAGGEAGMSKLIVAKILDLSLSQLSRKLARLAEAGVIAEVGISSERIKVRPPALRHVLLREVFFSGAASLPNSILKQFVSNAPDLIEAVRELIYVKSRDGRVSDYFLQEYLLELPTAWSLWEAYAWQGYEQAAWVLDHFQVKASYVANACLMNCPQRIIPLLLLESIGDNRPLNAHPDHPLRKIKDWVEGAYPETGKAVRQRQALYQSVRRWLQEGNDETVGYQTILFALSPRFEVMISDPGLGNHLTLRSGYLSIDEIIGLREIWNGIIELTRDVSVSDWKYFIETIQLWAFPFRETSEEVRLNLRSFAIQMATDIFEKVDVGINVLRDLRDALLIIAPDLVVLPDPEIMILYPDQRIRDNWREQEAKWIADAHTLAEEWAGSEISDIVSRLAEIETLMGHNRYPCLVPAMCGRMAEIVYDPLEWLVQLVANDVSASAVYPFLQRCAVERVAAWDNIADKCLQLEAYNYIAAKIILLLDAPPTELLNKSIRQASKYPGLVSELSFRDKLSDQYLLAFLEHQDSAVASAAALTEWQSEPFGIVRQSARKHWEQVVLDSVKDDYWLAEIFKTEPHLAFSWLCLNLASEDFDWNRFHFTLPAATSVLDIEQRINLLSLVPISYGSFELVAHLVSDIEVYKSLLGIEHLRMYYLSPLGKSELDAQWQAYALLAFNNGYSEMDIAEETISPQGSVIFWSGRMSSRWESWINEFKKLLGSDDPTLKQIAEVGVSICQRRYDLALEREHLEDVHGRDN